MAGVFALAGDSPTSVVLVQILLAGATVAIAVRLAGRLASRRRALPWPG